MKITTGAQYGDPLARKALHTFKKELTKSLNTSMNDEYFRTISEIGLVIRASGEIWQFELNETCYARHSKQYNSITADIIIPLDRWKEHQSNQIREYIAMATTKCFEKICEKAENSKDLTDKNKFIADYSRAINLFLNPHPTEPTQPK
ncbi:hypothetical protein [Pseudomonas peradeniyensis]|uniref:Uncharacterized protein n=1 Tax=Pseudomonas peradeniyensis TaxID=2745488 RepID=A0ABT2VAM9_9PSED|nr:hypothetical protein [Pseudomonas peradeniyensis]MCU7238522.1 hypothetical protein [Pseudomonas peradeniyensis]